MRQDINYLQFAIESLRDSLYEPYFNPDFECQFQFTDDDRDLDLYGDAGDEPRNWRIPKNGDVCPTGNDRPIPHDPHLIKTWGTSWWDHKASLTVGCMVDVDCGHGAKDHTPEEIAEWDRKASQVSYLLNATSKGGAGRHGVVFLETPVPAKTRGQHKHNCRLIVAQLCADLGISPDFFCSWGRIQYIFDRTHAENGLQLIKPPTSKLVLPDNIDLSPFDRATEAEQSILSTEAAAHRAVMDETHRAIGDSIRASGWPFDIEEHNGTIVIHSHTKGLEADHTQNKRRGVFKTNTPGTDRHKANCFAFLKPDGGLAVRRYGDADETDTWHRGPSGIWCCDFNVAPTFAKACQLCGGRRNKKCVTFTNGRTAEAMVLLGIKADIPAPLNKKRIDLSREGTHLHISVHAPNCGDFEGWTSAYGKYDKTIEDCLPGADLPTYENRIRHTTDIQRGKDWMFLDDRGRWLIETLGAVKTYLKGFGHDEYAIAEIVKRHLEQNWFLTNIPFTKEYGPNRTWNRDGAHCKQSCKGTWSYCKMIVDHVGDRLTPYVEKDDWCKENEITTGGQYLMLWAALLFRKPRLRLPYLFFWSDLQNTGKSSYHRMLLRLFANKNGWCELRKEILKDDFNDLMRGCALAYIEEIDLSQSPPAYQLLKGLIDSPVLKIRGIYAPGEMEKNYVHFVQSANHRHHCPVYPGDTRIVMIPVDQFAGRDIPWTAELEGIVDQEAPSLLHELLNMPIPKRGFGRLFLPVLETTDKIEAMKERGAELAGWYGQLCEFAAAGEITNLEADAILKLLVATTNDPKLPRNAAGFGSRLKSLKSQLNKDRFDLTWQGTPAKYTICLMTSC